MGNTNIFENKTTYKLNDKNNYLFLKQEEIEK